MLGILHPDGVCDPARVGGGHVQVRVRVCVDVDLVAALQAQLIVVDTHLTKLNKIIDFPVFKKLFISGFGLQKFNDMEA